MQNYIAFAIPAFFILMGVELLVARLQRKQVYRLDDSINDINCGILQQVVVAFSRFAVVGLYTLIYHHYGVTELDSSLIRVWVACYMGADFCYYWFHRLSHEINFLWAAHVVHHQSEEYNLSVALRQSAFQPLLSAPFYWPLALLGFPPLVFFACTSFVTLYQFWIHTRTVKSMGFLEKILMTPSHHRVHHGRNPKYIDRNHGGTFIFWDKLFGTWQPEEEEPAYGITKPLASWNPVWANFQYWQELLEAARGCRNLRDRVLVFLKPPGWLPAYMGGFQAPPEVKSDYVKFSTPVSKPMAVYLFTQFLLMLAVTTWFIFMFDKMAITVRLLSACFLLTSMLALGALFEGKRHGFYLEGGRLALLALPAAVASGLGMPVMITVGGISLASGIWLLGIRPGAAT